MSRRNHQQIEPLHGHQSSVATLVSPWRCLQYFSSQTRRDSHKNAPHHCCYIECRVLYIRSYRQWILTSFCAFIKYTCGVHISYTWTVRALFKSHSSSKHTYTNPSHKRCLCAKTERSNNFIATAESFSVPDSRSDSRQSAIFLIERTTPLLWQYSNRELIKQRIYEVLYYVYIPNA